MSGNAEHERRIRIIGNLAQIQAKAIALSLRCIVPGQRVNLKRDAQHIAVGQRSIISPKGWVGGRVRETAWR